RLTHQPRPGAVELDLARGVGAVAQLVLEPLDVKSVERPVGQDSGKQETGKALRGLSQHQEDVTHRRRAEPLMTAQNVLAARSAPRDRIRPGGVGAHVRAALAFGHPYPGEQASLVSRRA